VVTGGIGLMTQPFNPHYASDTAVGRDFVILRLPEYLCGSDQPILQDGAEHFDVHSAFHHAVYTFGRNTGGMSEIVSLMNEVKIHCVAMISRIVGLNGMVDSMFFCLIYPHG
jgi:hypothetical protein